MRNSLMTSSSQPCLQEHREGLENIILLHLSSSLPSHKTFPLVEEVAEVDHSIHADLALSWRVWSSLTHRSINVNVFQEYVIRIICIRESFQITHMIIDVVCLSMYILYAARTTRKGTLTHGQHRNLHFMYILYTYDINYYVCVEYFLRARLCQRDRHDRLGCVAYLPVPSLRNWHHIQPPLENSDCRRGGRPSSPRNANKIYVILLGRWGEVCSWNIYIFYSM